MQIFGFCMGVEGRLIQLIHLLSENGQELARYMMHKDIYQQYPHLCFWCWLYQTWCGCEDHLQWCHMMLPLS